MTITIKDYSPAEAIERFGVLLEDRDEYAQDSRKNIEKGEVIEIFTESGGRIKLPFKSISKFYLFSSEITLSVFKEFAVEQRVDDAIHLSLPGAMVCMDKIDQIRHYENYLFTDMRKQELQSTLITFTNFPSSLISLIKSYLPSTQAEDSEGVERNNLYDLIGDLDPTEDLEEHSPDLDPTEDLEEHSPDLENL